jgi:hypothetical protein
MILRQRLSLADFVFSGFPFGENHLKRSAANKIQHKTDRQYGHRLTSIKVRSEF